MTKYILLISILIYTTVYANEPILYEDDADGYQEEARQWERTHIPTPNLHPQLWPLRPNVYGPGIGSDATGQPFKWTPGYGLNDPTLQVQPRTYGPNIGMDQYGRPVIPTCPYGVNC